MPHTNAAEVDYAGAPIAQGFIRPYYPLVEGAVITMVVLSRWLDRQQGLRKMGHRWCRRSKIDEALGRFLGGLTR